MESQEANYFSDKSFYLPIHYINLQKPCLCHMLIFALFSNELYPSTWSLNPEITSLGACSSVINSFVLFWRQFSFEIPKAQPSSPS